MEEIYIQLLQSFGVPVLLIVYYLFSERPRLAKWRSLNDERFDKLVNKVLEANEVCAEKMKQGMETIARSLSDLKD